MDVTVDGLRFARDGRVVLDIPALTFPRGTTTAIFGPNGSGKTTLLRLIAGLERPTAGAVRIADKPVLADPSKGRAARPGSARLTADRARRRQVAFAFQEAVFVSGSVRENLRLALQLRDVPEAEWESRIAEVAGECGVAQVLDRPARKLSAGEAQRVNLARALALRAPVVLLDEPLAGVDRIARTQLLDDLPRLLATFATTTILVTHDREEAFRLADHLVILIGGTVHAAGPKARIYQRPPDRQTAELLGYTVLPAGNALVAVPPGGLRLGTDDLGFLLAVERVVDMGNHCHVLGTIAGTRVDLRLPSGVPAPSPGAKLEVAAASFVALDRGRE